jgi:hypothetical protein
LRFRGGFEELVEVDLPLFEGAVVAYFGDGSEVAEFFIVGDLVYGGGLGLFGVDFRQEAGGDLQTEEEVAGAFGVDVVARDALKELEEG